MRTGAVVWVRLLGPLDVAVDGESRPVSGLRRKAVLATLALHDRKVVSTSRLVDVVWGESAPPTAVNTLQCHVSYLRSVLGSKTAILARPPGYVLDLGSDSTDVQAAERLLRQGTQAADPVQGAQDLQEALALWRGRPLADVAGSAWLEEQAERLDLLCDQLRRALTEARLAAGEHADLVPNLERIAADDPLDEQVHGQLMLALYRCGRQADALAAYHRLRAALAEQLGIDPSPMLRDLEMAVLRQDPALAAPTAAVTTLAARPVPVPAQLPPAVPGFVGRAAELASLDATLAKAAREPSGQSAAVVISAVSGTAGVGKTALALQWAHRVAAQFPGGQLYVNLRGFDPGGQAVEPAEAVRGFLDAFGVAVARIPDGLQAQAALYRSLVAGRRVLVVLDNARDAEQVRPLLPGSPGCLVIVTSRNQLAGLVATAGAHSVSLDLLATKEAGDLLARRLGEIRVASEPEAAGEIIERCARLPLALAIAAARAAVGPEFSLAAIAAELRQATGTLDRFDGTDLATNARAVFSWSYRLLGDGAARLFRLLGLHPGSGVSIPAAASLAGISPPRARLLLAELTSAHLLTEHSPGRYAFHDLLRTYAAEQARTLDRDPDRAAAVQRVLEHYLHTGHRAVALIEPYYAPIIPVTPAPEVVVGELVTIEDALSWFMAERATLLAAVQLAAEAGLATHAWQLAWALTMELLRRGQWDEQTTASNAALAAARRATDTAGEAHGLLALALGYSRSGRFEPAEPLFRQALRLLETSGGYLSSQAIVHSGLAWIAERRQCPAEMLRHSSEALALHCMAGNRAVQGMILNDIGYSHALAGDYQQALTCCEQALSAIQELGERFSESATWDSLGYIHHKLGNYQQAIACYERGIGLSRELSDLFNEADSLSSLGDVHDSAGNISTARRTWARALRIFERIDHPDGELVRAKLHSSNGRSPRCPAMDHDSLAHRSSDSDLPLSEPF